MKIIHYILLSALSFMAACSSDETNINEQGTVNLTINTGKELKTRTVLNSSENLQHIKQVYLYIFNKTTDIEAEATCVKALELNWISPTDVNYGIISRDYYIELDPGNYVLLAIGLDDSSGATYNLPNSVIIGTTLGEAKAILAQGKTKEDIANSELFTGFTTINVQAGNTSSTSIDLYRRVVGVLGYFIHIPYQINNMIVTDLQVRLYKNQVSSIVLQKQETQDYGTNDLVNSQTLIDINVSGYSKSDLGNFYAIPAQTNPLTLANSLLKGTYLLPVNAQTGVNTLQVCLLDGSNNILKTYEVKIESVYDFSLESNQFYSLGINTNSKSTDDDKPIDLLLNNEIVITVNPNWEDNYTLNLQ